MITSLTHRVIIDFVQSIKVNFGKPLALYCRYSSLEIEFWAVRNYDDHITDAALWEAEREVNIKYALNKFDITVTIISDEEEDPIPPGFMLIMEEI